jgi:hypothetical protein
MEAAYLTVSGGVPGLRDVKSYDYFFFVNCSMTGPALTSTTRPGPWTSQFKRLIDNCVKMTGLNLNCRQVYLVHIQSMVYAVDKLGLEIIMKSGAIFNCMQPPHSNNAVYIIETYEKKLGAAILNAGYALQQLIGGNDMIVTQANVRECVPCEFFNLDENKKTLGANFNVTEFSPGCFVRNQFKDIWMESRLRSLLIGGVGYVPRLDDVMFFKTSRWLPPYLVAKINYTGNITWIGQAEGNPNTYE